MTIEIVVLMLQILILLAILALKSYATEKGKNQATKEDIGEITMEVESAKIDFLAQIEKLKTDLSADMQRQMNLFVKRNEAFTQFFDDTVTLLAFLRSPFPYSYEYLDEIDKHIREGRERIFRAVVSYYRLILYAQDKSITTTASETAAAIGDLQDAWLELTLKYRNAFAEEAKEYERAIETKDYSLFDQGKPSDKIKIEIAKDIVSLLDAIEDNLKGYGNALYAHFQSVDNSKALAATTGDSLEK